MDIGAKVLILDSDSDALRVALEIVKITGIRPQRPGAVAVLGILGTNVDLGGILLAEDYLGTPAGTFNLVKTIRSIRPELPVFLRRSDEHSGGWITDLPPNVASMFRRTYSMDGLADFAADLSSQIFTRVYPAALARGIHEISMNSLKALFKGFEITGSPPYLVFDRIIPGEVFTLIGIDSDWCRGYMTWQGSHDELEHLVRVEYPLASSSFREVNQYLGELTNLVWGGFRNRFVSGEPATTRVQVPIVINAMQRFISFGSEDPQLCFKFDLTPIDPKFGTDTISLYQRFIFNLSWRPEDFKEVASVESLLQAGELEFF
jgi:hypothetical protein